MTARLEARRLGYRVGGRSILAGVDLALEAGERLAVTGPSGSGKTSLLALLSGLASPTEGAVLLDGSPLDGFARPAKGVAVVLQGYGLVSLLTAAENVEVALLALNRPRRDARRGAAEAIEAVGLEPHADQLVDELSGGQQQRVAIARALALEPRLLIADEPTAELDRVARSQVLDRLLEVTDRGGTLVLATHDPEVAQRCDHCLDLHSPASG